MLKHMGSGATDQPLMKNLQSGGFSCCCACFCCACFAPAASWEELLAGKAEDKDEAPLPPPLPPEVTPPVPDKSHGISHSALGPAHL